MEDWGLFFDVNVKGTMSACKHFGKVMREKKRDETITCHQ
jgi:NAD(P)-dependent dehydrogenase (short-subunit alcohol dehydrogenase family)